METNVDAIHEWQLSRLNNCLQHRANLSNIPNDVINLCDYLQEKFEFELMTARDYCSQIYLMLKPNENDFSKSWHLLPESIGTARPFIYNVVEGVSDFIGLSEVNAQLFAPQAVEMAITTGSQIRWLREQYPELNGLIVASAIAICQKYRITSEIDLITHIISFSTYQQLLQDPLFELMQLAVYMMN